MAARRDLREGDQEETLNARGSRKRAYTTYMTIMARLTGKGLLERRRSGKTDFYRPVYSREQFAICAPAPNSTLWSINSATLRSPTSPGRWPSWTRNAVDPCSALPAGCDNADRTVFALALALGASGLIVASTAVTTAASAVLGHSRDGGTVVLAVFASAIPPSTAPGCCCWRWPRLERSRSPWPPARAGGNAGNTSG